MHNNKLVGKGGKHPLTVWARENKLRMTPKDLSTATVYCPFSLHARVDADVSGLEHALKVYWRDNNLGLGEDGELPADMELRLGSRIKLWSAGVHRDIGYAYGHPKLDGKPRWFAVQVVACPNFVSREVIFVSRETKNVSCGARFDVVKYLDPTAAAPAGEDETADTPRPSFKLGCIMLCFRVCSPAFGARCLRDFVLVREMKLAPRHPTGPFPYLPCEKAIGDFDRDDPRAINKLGRLWTWDTPPRGSRPVFAVKSANELIETVAIMPRWKSATSDEWSIDTGVYEPRYLNDARNRPPFPGECKCGAKE